ncbi:response regulator [Usitatibacter rugosus]|nr:response regulator transcription factor [Usitatibacter rugosus]
MTETGGKSLARIRVMVVDDHPLLRDGIVAVVAQEADMEIVAQAGNGREAIERYREHAPDVAVLDVRMPDIDGVEACATIRAEAPEARIVMLTTYPGDVQMVRALKAGASGYLLKSMVRTELLDAIRAVHAGRRYLPAEVSRELAAHRVDELLTARELAVLRQVAAGNSNRDAANALFVSEDTIKAHMKNISSKLAAKDRTHAVTIAIQRGILDVT